MPLTLQPCRNVNISLSLQQESVYYLQSSLYGRIHTVMTVHFSRPVARKISDGGLCFYHCPSFLLLFHSSILPFPCPMLCIFLLHYHCPPFHLPYIFLPFPTPSHHIFLGYGIIILKLWMNLREWLCVLNKSQQFDAPCSVLCNLGISSMP